MPSFRHLMERGTVIQKGGGVSSETQSLTMSRARGWEMTEFYPEEVCFPGSQDLGEGTRSQD